MKLTRTLVAAAAITVGGFALAAPAYAGDVIPTCTTVEWANGAGSYVVVTTPDGPIGPLDPVAGSIPAEPDTEYTVTWFGPGANDGPIVVWDARTVTTPTCATAPTTTQAAPTTSEAPSSTTTPGVNLPCPLPIFRPGIGWACPPVQSTIPPINESVCDIDLTGCLGTTTTVAAPPSELPPTGGNVGLAAAAGALLVIGSTLVLVRRRPA